MAEQDGGFFGTVAFSVTWQPATFTCVRHGGALASIGDPGVRETHSPPIIMAAVAKRCHFGRAAQTDSV